MQDVYQFRASIAEKVGIVASIVFEAMAAKIAASGPVSPATVSEVKKNAPILTEKQVRSSLLALESAGLVIRTGNASKYSRAGAFTVISVPAPTPAAGPAREQRATRRQPVPKIIISKLNISAAKHAQFGYRISAVGGMDRDADTYEKMAIWCWLLIRDNFPEYQFIKLAELEKWAKEVRLLMDQVKDQKEFTAVFLWAVNNREHGITWKGWWAQVRSTANFRKNYEEIKIRYELSKQLVAQPAPQYSIPKNEALEREKQRLHGQG